MPLEQRVRVAPQRLGRVPDRERDQDAPERAGPPAQVGARPGRPRIRSAPRSPPQPDLGHHGDQQQGSEGHVPGVRHHRHLGGVEPDRARRRRRRAGRAGRRAPGPAPTSGSARRPPRTTRRGTSTACRGRRRPRSGWRAWPRSPDPGRPPRRRIRWPAREAWGARRRAGRDGRLARPPAARPPTKPRLDQELAGCFTQPARAASQKLSPRPTSGPSHPAPTATTSSPVAATATAAVTARGCRDLEGTRPDSASPDQGRGDAEAEPVVLRAGRRSSRRCPGCT